MDHRNGRVASAERRIPRHLRDDTITGRIPQPGRHDPVFYTDGAVDQQRHSKGIGLVTGWGYLSTNGDYGCGKAPQFTPKTGIRYNVVTELRAVWHAIGIITSPATIVTTNPGTADVLRNWQAGSTTMPAGYIGSTRKTSTLERLRRQVAANPASLTIRHVSDTETVLNDAADTLARLGTRWAREQLDHDDVGQRAARITAGFLADWRHHA